MKESFEDKLYDYIQNELPYGRKFYVDKSDNKDRIIAIVKEIIVMQWDWVCGFGLEIAEDETWIRKVDLKRFDINKNIN